MTCAYSTHIRHVMAVLELWQSLPIRGALNSQPVLKRVWQINLDSGSFRALHCWATKPQIGRFTAVCSKILALTQASPLSHLNANMLASEQLKVHTKSNEGCMKTRSPPASLPFKG